MSPIAEAGRPAGSAAAPTGSSGKGHDTFAPLGPWIVPKEFYGDPMKRLSQTLTVDGKVMQKASATDMIHSIYELIEYGSSIITLFPGDMINNGTSGGTGMGAAYRGEQRFLKPGEKMVAAIEGIGSMTLPVVAGNGAACRDRLLPAAHQHLQEVSATVLMAPVVWTAGAVHLSLPPLESGTTKPAMVTPLDAAHPAPKPVAGLYPGCVWKTGLSVVVSVPCSPLRTQAV